MLKYKYQDAIKMEAMKLKTKLLVQVMNSKISGLNRKNLRSW